MTQPIHADVLIVGAGMVGLTLANALAPSGLDILLLEQRPLQVDDYIQQLKQQQAEGYDPRVSALTCASQQILTVVGAWERMQAYRLSPYLEMSVWDGQGTGQIHFSARELHEPALGHIVENRVTLAGLLQASQQHSNIRLLSGVEVTALSAPQESGRAVQLSDGREVQTSLVVAADGALSKTRKMAAIPIWEWDYGHHAIITTVKTERPHQRTAWQRFTDDGPLALLPLHSEQGENYCSIVWSTSPEHARQLMALENAEFAEALEQAFESRLGSVQWVDKRVLFPLRQRHAQHYVEPGLAVIGDAAHTIHPLAGQGVNLGLLDAAQLAEELLAAQARGESLGSERVLHRFQRQRQSENIQMAAAMEGFKRLFSSEQPAAILARNLGMNLLNRISPVKNHIVMEAMGLRDNLPSLAQRPVRK